MHIDSFAESVSNIGEAFDSFNERMEDFEKIYVKMLTNVSNRKLKTTLCTIYNPCFEHNDMERLTYMLPPNPNIKKLQKRSVTALPIFNNIIFQEAFNFGLPVMDLRLIFNDKEDYANPIETSAVGGMKMVKIIKEISENHDYFGKNSTVYI